MNFTKFWSNLFVIGVLLVGCSSPDDTDTSSEEPDGDLTIYTTVYPLQYIVEELGGDTVTAHSVFPPGVDGHIYEPTSKDMTDFAKSDAFIYVGAGMEGFADSVSNALASEDVSLLEIGDYEELFQKGLHENQELAHDEEQIRIDIEGLSDHYHTGDTIHLTAELQTEAEYDHWHWFKLGPDEEEWQVAEGLDSETYEGEAAIPDEQIKAVLYNDDHEVVAESDAVTIIIDDHGDDEEHHDDHEHHHSHEHDDHSYETHENENENHAVNIEGLASHYHTGDTISLTAIYQEDAADGHWHWYTRSSGEEEWEAAEGQHGDTYETQAEVSELQIKAVLYGSGHEIISESEPQTIIIDDHTDHDPHIWVDPLRMIEIAGIIKEKLIELNPDAAELYNENFDILEDKLTDLDQRYIDVLNQKENKHIIVPHSAFGYWEERYGVQQITISGLSSSEEPSQKDLVEVMETAEAFDLEYILYEQNSDNRLSRVVQEEIGAEALTIHNLEVRTVEDIENGEDYISLMEYNLEILDQITK